MATLAKLREAKRKHDEDVRAAVDAIPATKFTDENIAALFANVDRIIAEASQRGSSSAEIRFRVGMYKFDVMGFTPNEFGELMTWWEGALGKASRYESSNLTRKNNALIDLLIGLSRLWRERSDVPLQLSHSVDKTGYAVSGTVTWLLDWSEPEEAPAKKARTGKADKK